MTTGEQIGVKDVCQSKEKIKTIQINFSNSLKKLLKTKNKGGNEMSYIQSIKREVTF